MRIPIYLVDLDCRIRYSTINKDELDTYKLIPGLFFLTIDDAFFHAVKLESQRHEDELVRLKKNRDELLRSQNATT